MSAAGILRLRLGANVKNKKNYEQFELQPDAQTFIFRPIFDALDIFGDGGGRFDWLLVSKRRKYYQSFSGRYDKYSDRRRLDFNDVSAARQGALRRTRRSFSQHENFKFVAGAKLDHRSDFNVSAGNNF